MPVGLQHLVDSLAGRDLILPYFESSMISDSWPDEYLIRVDSKPYYGLGDGYFHPSTHPMLGERELYYRFHPDTRDKMIWERNSLQRQMTLSMGSALHAVLQTQMELADLVVPEDIEVEYVNHQHHVRGRIDWIVNHPNGQRIVVEFKTRTHFKFSRQDQPEDAWRAQINLGMDSQDCDFGIILMAESGWPYAMREFHIRRDPLLLDSIYSKFDRVRGAIAANEPPRHCCGPDDKQTISACPARYECWLKE